MKTAAESCILFIQRYLARYVRHVLLNGVILVIFQATITAMSDKNTSEMSWAEEKEQDDLLATSTTEPKSPNNDESKTPVLESKTPVLESKTPVLESKTPVPESKTPNPESKTPNPESKTPASAPHYKVTLEDDKVRVEEVVGDGEATLDTIDEGDGATATVDQLATVANKVCLRLNNFK